MTTTSAPDAYRTSESSVQCRCPFCGGRFNPDTGRPQRGDERFKCCCARCGHVWTSGVEDPSRCPKCGNSKWRESVEPCICKRCGYKWNPRSSGRLPLTCPSCKSREWDADPEVSDVVDKEAVLQRYVSGEGCIAIASEMDAALFEVIGIVREATGDDEPCLRVSGRSAITYITITRGFQISLTQNTSFFQTVG